jgi:AraC-like DNA-binding protein
MAHFKQFTFKKFGFFDFQQDISDQLKLNDYASFIKIVFVKASGCVTIDFTTYQLEQDAIFFINVGQYYQFGEGCTGTMIYYNRDFYCVEIHDKEVACDGILFHNVYEIPVVLMSAQTSLNMQQIINEMKAEFERDDSSMEEMLRILLKQLIIKSTRLWKQKHQQISADASAEVEFTRTFSQLVEWHYTKHHTVADYADLLNISPKALNKRITRYSNTSPNDIIKNRIIMEAKRLLVHTNLSVKEIGYKLGYDDPSYFIRLFTKQAETSPQHFRQQYAPAY